jgi:hypothetical protein
MIPDNIAAAFREVTLGLMAWREPPLMGPMEYRRLELLSARQVYRPYDPQGEVEPYDLDQDWSDTGN